ncbi:hypothetical protein AYI69_g1938, partial [Smittium culicis]
MFNVRLFEDPTDGHIKKNLHIQIFCTHAIVSPHLPTTL